MLRGRSEVELADGAPRGSTAAVKPSVMPAAPQIDALFAVFIGLSRLPVAVRHRRLLLTTPAVGWRHSPREL